MANFTYKATARDGSIATGTLSAADRNAAFRELDLRKLQPLSLSESQDAKGQKPEKTQQPDRETVRLKPAEVLDFTEELAQLLQGGIPLESALGIIERREGKSNLPLIAGKLRLLIRDGNSLSNALKTSCPDFGLLYCRLVAAGEESGALADILARQAVHLKALLGLKNKVIFALIYPAFLSVSAIGVSVLFIVFLIPKLMELLDTTGGTLPLGARVIVGAGEFVQATWYIWLALLAGAFVFFRWFSHRHPLKWDQAVMRIPLFGTVVRGRQHVQFLETMASLIGNGLPIVQALALTGNSMVSPVFRKELELILASVTDGDPLSACLARSASFPVLMSDLVAVGEQTGDLAGALERAAHRFDAELTRHVDRLSAIIQPAVVVVMAGMVGCMAYLMISAIFQTMSGLGG